MTFKRLLKGYKNFQDDYFNKNPALFERLNDGQSPETMIIACSDSRIDPAILTQSEPGDIFSVRNVAAMVAPYAENSNDHGTGAAVEYAVKVLKVEHIVILGHALCGGVRALAEAGDKVIAQEGFIDQWINIGQRARRKVMRILARSSFEQKLRALEQASILLSLNSLMTYPWVKEAVKAGKLHLHGWYFDFPNAQLLSYDPATSSFSDILTSQGKPAVSAHGTTSPTVPFSLVEFLQQVKDFTEEADLEKTFDTLKKCNKEKAGSLGKRVRKAGYALCGCCPAGAEETVATIISTL